MRIIGLLNSYCEGLSGGDIRFIEIAKRLNDYNKIVVTSLLGKKLCESKGLTADYLITTKEQHFKNVVFTYINRILKALLLQIDISKGDILYSSSDFLPDVLPAFIWKLRNKRAKWIVCIFLIIPAFFKDYAKRFTSNNFSFPNINRLLYFVGQALTIFFAKHRANQILVLNSMDKEYLIKNKNINADLISVVNGAINYNYITLSIPNHDKVYAGIFLARFHPQKGIFALIKIWKLICEKKLDAKLCIIGSGPRYFVEEIKIFVEKNNLTNNINLVSLKIGTEKFVLLKSAKIFLYPSYYESFGIVIAEAMACGLPVVTWNLPIYEDIYGENILRLPIGNIKEFAEVVIRLLDDEGLRNSLGSKGQKFIQKYDWNKIAKRESKILKSL